MAKAKAQRRYGPQYEYERKIANINPEAVYIQTCTAHGTPLLYGPYASFYEAEQANISIDQVAIEIPCEMLWGFEFDPALHARIIAAYMRRG